MLTVLVQDFNTFTQEFYNSVIESLQFHLLECTCGHAGCLSIHGYYTRSVITPHGRITLSICRVICSECGHTHALLLSSMVAYSQIPAEDQRIIAEAYETELKPHKVCTPDSGIYESVFKTVTRRYTKHWRERLRAEGISLASLPNLTRECFSHYSRQFMQIRGTPNKLFVSPT